MSRQKDFPVFFENGKAMTTYRAVVFDMDGTLYHQKRLRLIMALRLCAFYLLRPWRWKELLALKCFREVRDRWDEIVCQETGFVGDGSGSKDPADASGFRPIALNRAQYAYVAAKTQVSTDTVAEVVRRWIYENPLSALRKCRREEIAAQITALRANGMPVYLLSDYPVREKLKALALTADAAYSPEEDGRLTELKPSPMGLNLILEDHALQPSEVLMVGDRDEKDGEAARRAGVDYLIV